MNIYNLDSYTEIRSFYPVWYHGFLEMEAIWHSFGVEIDNVKKCVIRTIDDNFAITASIEALKALEEYLKIDGTKYLLNENNTSISIAERRAYVASCFIASGRIGRGEIEEIAKNWTKGVITVSANGANVNITILKAKNDEISLAPLRNLMEKRLPAHLRVKMNVNIEISKTAYVKPVLVNISKMIRI